MALNPQLYGNGMPVAFVGEMFVLARDGVEFQVDKIPGFVSLLFDFSGFRFYLNFSEYSDLLQIISLIDVYFPLAQLRTTL
jgi:hypothetical protein